MQLFRPSFFHSWTRPIASPPLQEGSNCEVVRSLQQILTNGAPGQWNTTPVQSTQLWAEHQSISQSISGFLAREKTDRAVQLSLM
jgi:hypothetical protein